jgi:hypothetical protein
LRVGILTHHNIKNYGAYLQAYALLKTIQDLGHDVVTVNFMNMPHVFANYRPFFIRRLKLNKCLTTDMRNYFHGYGQFAKFGKAMKHLALTEPVFRASRINALGLDALVVGSDEVWNFKDRGYHPVKFGVGIKVPILISYAAGTGSVMPDDQVPQHIVDGLRKFDGISVRECNGVDFIQSVLGITPKLVLDPTLIYDFKAEESPSPRLNSNYLLVYQCKLDYDFQRVVSDYAKSHNLMLIGAGCSDTWFDRNLISIDPFEWVGLFKNAEMVVTGTFHGTVFATKYRRDFISYPTSLNRVNKVHSYLNQVGLQSRVTCHSVDEFAALLHTPVDYDVFGPKLLMQRNNSIGYLTGYLSGV